MRFILPYAQETPLVRKYASSATTFLANNFSPSNISGLLTWLDVVSSTITKDGSNLIASITDLSGNSNTFNQSNGTLKPTYTADDGDGFPCVTHASKYMTGTNSHSTVTEETIFMVVKITSVTAATRMMFGASTGNWGAWHDNTTAVPRINWATSASTVNGTGGIRDNFDCNTGSKYKILRFRRKVGTGRDGFTEIYENGCRIKRETHSSGSSTFTTQIGTRGSSTTTANNMKWRVFLHYNGALTDVQCTQIESYLNSRYNVFTVPAWAVNESPAVKRYAIANDITSAGSMPGGEKEIIIYTGDSQCTGYAPVAGFDAKYIAAFTNSYIYEYVSTLTWDALNTTDTVSRNNKALAQGYAGMEAPLAWELENLSRKPLILKYGNPGATLADDGTDNNFNIGRNTSNYPTRLRRYLEDSINREVCLNGTRLVNKGIIIYLGTNDATDAYYANIQTNYTALINFLREVPGWETRPVVLCEIFSTSASYPRITEARAAVVATAAANSNCTHIDGPDVVGDTVDNTHVNGATYGSMASLSITALG